MTQRIEIKKGLIGRRSIGYDCPRCQSRLTSPLDDAGKSDVCPDCNAGFIVPGVEERNRIREMDAAEARRHAEQKQAAAAERSERKERTRKHREIERQRREALAAIEQQAPSIQPPILNAKPKRSRVGYYVLAFFLFAGFLGAIQDGNRGDSAGSTSRSSTSSTGKWYVGGNLQTALEWQDATYENKLATCADCMAALWLGKALKPELQSSIKSVDGLRPYAEELVDFIDAATRRDPDPELNRKMFVNQTVTTMATTGVVMMGWVK